MKRAKSGRKARAVLLVLAGLAATAASLRWAIGPRTAPVVEQTPPPPPRPAPPLADAEAPPPGPEWPEGQPFALLGRVDPALAGPVWSLFTGSTWTQKTAALELAGHFVASDTLTGLCPEAGDTLWVLSEAIRLRRGGKAALDQMYTDLRRAADLEDYEKDDFVDSLQDPIAMYVPLAISHSPHVHEARRMFERMRKMVKAQGMTLTEWIAKNDPDLRFAPGFLLRLNAYEVLVPYLRANPEEARAAAPMIFPQRRAWRVDLTADEIQNVFDSLRAGPKGEEALTAFVEGCLTQITMSAGPEREKLSLFLRLNWDRLPPETREAAAFVIGAPEGLVAQSTATLRVPTPYDLWPAKEWRFTLHFADEKDLALWQGYFQARGFRPEPAAEAVALAKQVPHGPRLVLLGYHYASLDTGMMFGPALKRFQQSLARDLKDPAVQGVVIRAHAQFSRTPAFRGAQPGPKLWYDGSCRGAGDLAKLAVLCPDCVLVGNVGSGRGWVNNPMIWALVEGLARHEDWDQLGARIKAAVGSQSTRLIGPWSTPFSQELKTLKKKPKHVDETPR